jgi:hypothetical protein
MLEVAPLAVGPPVRERLRAGIVNAGPRDRRELVDVTVGDRSELEPFRAQTETEQRPQSRRSGLVADE